ncbi:MAG: uroporphyrinogen-III synthase [Betaproteobacteria bacterium]|nr:uroporphyrinogen-III synthase [Betaproteobacteria bacterium]
MSPQVALAGLGILVTRPAAQSAGLMRRLADLGAEPLLFPALAILPPADPAALARTLAHLDRYDLALFISPNAVERGLAAVADWPAGLKLAAVGQGTAACLGRAGFTEVLHPAAEADSEHLLALPELADMQGRRVLIFRGEGGREFLAETLIARGAQADYAECYRRGLPPDADPAPLLAACAQGRLHAVTVFSAETLDNLYTLAGAEGAQTLRALPLFAPHPRIADRARALGVCEAIATAPGEDGLIAGLVEYFGHA